MLVAATAVVKGADWFVESAVWIAGRTGMSEMTVGATLVAVATTLPETAVSTYASWAGHPELALGNALGSCLANGALILGFTAILGRFTPVGRDFTGRCVALMLIVALLAAVSGGGEINRVGALLLLTVVGAIAWSASRRASRAASGRGDHIAEGTGGSDRPGKVEETNGSISYLLKFLFGAALIGIGSRYLVSAGTSLALALGMSEAVIGLTLIAIGTSLPELATSIAAGVRGHTQLALGNLLGANMLNLTLVLGLAGLVRPLPVDHASVTVHLPLVAALTVLLLLFAVSRRGLGRPEGATLLVLYGSYLVMLLR